MSEQTGNRENRGENSPEGKKKLRVLLRTFGCQMNVRDSEFAAGILCENGFRLADSADSADVILFNTCSVRQHAEDKLFSNIAMLGDRKKKDPGIVIGLLGCTAQNYKDLIFRKAPLVDFVCGPGNIGDLPDIISDVIKNRCGIVAADKVNRKREELFPSYRNSSFKAYVSIGEGCNNFCSYCIVPYVRGKERSRSASDIVREIKDLARRGFKEITLLGQNVNSYSSGRYDFVKLLEGINKVDGIERVRFMTSHPKDASKKLFRAMRDLDKVCEHLHLPLQSGSNRILRLMNRKYEIKRYLGLVSDYRKNVPEGSITTDIIVGFPSESDNDFIKTRNVMKEVGFDSAFFFKYSPRPPARSIGLEDDVPSSLKDRRLQALLGMQYEISEKKNKKLIGDTLDVLVDGFNAREGSMFTGRTRTNKIAVFKGGKNLVGKIVNIKIESATPHALKGRLSECP